MIIFAPEIQSMATVMKRFLGTYFLLSLFASCMLSCSPRHYVVQEVGYQSMKIDNRYDAAPDAETSSFLAPYRARVDSLVSPVVGHVAADMISDRPESKLSNLLADILIWAGNGFGEKPVVSIYNMGGIRASLSAGDVTIGDVIDVAPFENKLCFLTLKGSQLITLFQQIASRGGEGVNHAVKAVISTDNKLVSLMVNGEAVNPDSDYRIATIDYLADGNDGMPELKNGTERKMLTDDSNNLRFVIIDYFRENMKAGRVVDAQIEGRITVEKGGQGR